MRPTTLILGSRSPRRRQLLQQIAPYAEIDVMAPQSAAEAGFVNLADRPSIEQRLGEIARTKAADVLSQIRERERIERESKTDVAYRWDALIAADTVIVVYDKQGRPKVLGQPPEDQTWKDVVRFWFREYYSGRQHLALTALHVAAGDGRTVERLVATEVTFISDVEGRLEWYLDTGEPRGKAGGYAIQGAGSVFVQRVEGSLSNVVGLPLEALLETFEELGIHVARPSGN
jgi:septum formation protein